MSLVRKTGLIAVVIIISAFRIIFVPAEVDVLLDSNFQVTKDCDHKSEFQNAECSSNYATEVRDFSRTISEVSRFLTFNVLENQVVPRDINLHEFGKTPILTSFLSFVPIFIRGCSLLN